MSVMRTSRLVLLDGGEGLLPVGGAGDDGDVGLEREESGESAEDHALVFGEDDFDGGWRCSWLGSLKVWWRGAR